MSVAAHPFRAAVEARDPEAIEASLAPAIVLHSPFSLEPIEGRNQVAAALRLFGSTLEGLHYTDEFVADGERRVILFRAGIGGHEIEGIDVLRDDPDDAGVAEFHLFFRPHDALAALRAALAPKFRATGLAPID